MAEDRTAGASGELAEAAPAESRRLNHLAWFVPYGIVVAGLLVFGLPDFRSRGPEAQLAVLLAYMSAACTFLPLPTTPWVIWAASPAGPHANPLVVATVCTVGTCVANLHDYYLLTYLYRYGRVQKVRRTRVYAWLSRFFRWSPLATLAAASCVPIPEQVGQAP